MWSIDMPRGLQDKAYPFADFASMVLANASIRNPVPLIPLLPKLLPAYHGAGAGDRPAGLHFLGNFLSNLTTVSA
jgi:hypothetical protein